MRASERAKQRDLEVVKRVIVEQPPSKPSVEQIEKTTYAADQAYMETVKKPIKPYAELTKLERFDLSVTVERLAAAEKASDMDDEFDELPKREQYRWQILHSIVKSFQ